MFASIVSLFLLVTPVSEGGSTGPTRAPGASSTSKPWDSRDAAARRQYQQKNFGGAAASFETLWNNFRQPEHLFNAAISRYYAGHHGHAVKHLDAYLDLPKPSAKQREQARLQLEEARKHTVPLTLGVVSVKAVGPITLWITPSTKGAERPRMPFVTSVGRPGEMAKVQRQVWLDPGEWYIFAEADGYVELQKKVHVAKRTGAKVVLELHPKEAPERNRRKLGLGLLGVGGAGAAVGAIVTGTSGFQQAEESLRAARNQRWGGTFVLSLGGAAMAMGSVAFVRKPKLRFTTWVTTTVVGGGTFVAGVILAKEWNDHLNRYRYPEPLTWAKAKRYARLHTMSGALTGFGAGLIVGSTIGLIDTAIDRRKRAKVPRKNLTFAPLTYGQLGLSVSGRF